MWDLFGFDVEDVFSGRRAPEWAWGLMDRLIDEPWSRWRAKQVGGDKWREHLGWSPDTYLAALSADVQQVAVAIADAARVQKKPRLPKPLPRPTFKKDDPDVEMTDEELAALVRQLDM